jgi:hypothetical protein
MNRNTHTHSDTHTQPHLAPPTATLHNTTPTTAIVLNQTAIVLHQTAIVLNQTAHTAQAMTRKNQNGSTNLNNVQPLPKTLWNLTTDAKHPC